MENKYQKMLLKLINKAKDEVEWKSRVFAGAWHRSLFDNDYLNRSLSIWVYGDCIPYGVVIANMYHQTVEAFDDDMVLLHTWEIK